MRPDIIGVVPKIGDTIIRAMYSRDANIHVCKVIGETKKGDPKLQEYWKNQSGRYVTSLQHGNSYAPGAFLVVTHLIQLS